MGSRHTFLGYGQVHRLPFEHRCMGGDTMEAAVPVEVTLLSSSMASSPSSKSPVGKDTIAGLLRDSRASLQLLRQNGLYKEFRQKERPGRRFGKGYVPDEASGTAPSFIGDPAQGDDY